MLAGGTDAGYRAMLGAGGGQPLRRVEVWRSGSRIDGFGDRGLPIESGSVSATLSSRVTRTVSLVVADRSLYPWRGGDLLDPLGSELWIFVGWRSGAGVPWMWPVFRGPITKCSIDTDAPGVAVEAADLAEMVLADEFPTPRDSGAGALITGRVMDLISDSLPDAVFDTGMDETFAVVGQATWDTDRGKALDDLASAAGCHWYSLAGGEFTLRRIPWAATALGEPVVTLSAASGLKRARVETGRDGVANYAAVTAEPKDGSVPVYGAALDETDSSRTNIRGPLGRRVKVFREDGVTSAPQATSLARQRLVRLRTQVSRWTADMVADPSLELGDVCRITTMGMSTVQALASFTLPLTGDMVMGSTWRGPDGVVDE